MVSQVRNVSAEERIISMISWSLNVPSTKIHPYTNLQNDLNLDKIDLILLIAELENRFSIYLTKEQVESIETVSDATYFFASRAAA
jgi:acyl carrier protein